MRHQPRPHLRLHSCAVIALALGLPAAAGAEQPSSARQAAIAEARELVARLRGPGKAALRPGQLARVRGFLASRGFPISRQAAIGNEPARLGRAKNNESIDPTYRGRHPMFRRVAETGWFRDKATLDKLQRLANNLRNTRSLSPFTSLREVELLVFDLEATGGSAGHFDGKKNRVHFGWDGVTQFGYTVYRGGAAVSSGTINIRPDVSIDPEVERITGLSEAKLASAPRFEKVAGQILSLMQNRVLVGHGSFRNDWSRLQSNFARLGVDLPSPRGIMLDTYVLSFNRFAAGASLKKLCEALGVNQGRAHDGGYDARATGDAFHVLMNQQNIRTLGEAFALQDAGRELMHRPRVDPLKIPAAAPTQSPP